VLVLVLVQVRVQVRVLVLVHSPWQVGTLSPEIRRRHVAICVRDVVRRTLHMVEAVVLLVLLLQQVLLLLGSRFRRRHPRASEPRSHP